MKLPPSQSDCVTYSTQEKLQPLVAEISWSKKLQPLVREISWSKNLLIRNRNKNKTVVEYALKTTTRPEAIAERFQAWEDSNE